MIELENNYKNIIEDLDTQGDIENKDKITTVSADEGKKWSGGKKINGEKKINEFFNNFLIFIKVYTDRIV